MATGFQITDEMRAQMGIEGPPWPSLISSTAAQMFARALSYRDPAWYLDDEARRRGYDGVPVVPCFLGTPVFDPRVCEPRYGRPRLEGQPVLAHGLTNVLDGGTEFIYERPLRVGETLLFTTKIAGLDLRESRSVGTMLVVTTEQIYRDEHDEVVVRAISTALYY